MEIGCVQEKLCLVEDTLFVKGRGLVLMTTHWQTGQIRVGDWIELRSAGGQSYDTPLQSCVESIEMVRFAPGSERVVDAEHPGGLLLPNLSREDVHRGDEVWSVPDLPMRSSTDHSRETSIPSSKSWWKRLLLKLST